MYSHERRIANWLPARLLVLMALMAMAVFSLAACAQTQQAHRYTLTIADCVGNTSVFVAATAKVDTAAPTVSVSPLALVTGAGNQHYDAPSRTLFFRSTAFGSFDLGATSSDTDTSVASVAFPDVSGTSGWSGSTA